LSPFAVPLEVLPPDVEEDGWVGCVFPPEDEDAEEEDDDEPLEEEGLPFPHKVMLAGTPLCSPGRGGFKQGSVTQTCRASVLKYLQTSFPGLEKSPPSKIGSAREPVGPPAISKSTQL